MRDLRREVEHTFADIDLLDRAHRWYTRALWTALAGAGFGNLGSAVVRASHALVALILSASLIGIAGLLISAALCMGLRGWQLERRLRRSRRKESSS